MAAAKRDTCVVHLVRASNGPDPLEAFLDSYRGHPAGVEHELVLVFKGYSSDEAAETYRALASDVCRRFITVADDAYDLGAYLDAARCFERGRICFLNSFSTFNVDGWLARLAGALDRPGVALAGVSGSWGSVASMTRYDMRLGGPYGDVFDDRRAMRAAFRSLGESGDEPPVTLSGRVRRAARKLHEFPPFPAPHLRTNGFLIERDLMLRLRLPRPRTKFDTYLIESGRDSLTRRVERTGSRTVVVGADGEVYERADWARSRTFWQANQENLLVSDRQTRIYERGGPIVRLALSRFAWGTEADPILEQAVA